MKLIQITLSVVSILSAVLADANSDLTASLQAQGNAAANAQATQNANNVAALQSTAATAQSSGCKAMASFTACSTNSANQIAACSAAVINVPDISYYQCVCTAQNALNNCYNLCPDDANLQLQYKSIMSSSPGTCQYVAQQLALGNTTSLPIGSTVNVTVGFNGTKVAIPVPKKILPPVPKSNNTNANGTAGVNYDNGAVAMGFASSLTLVAILLTIALF